MIINSKMQMYLDELKNIEIQDRNCSIDFGSIESIIFPTFIEWDDCILLRQKGNTELPPHFSPNQFISDRTAFEANFNHIHLNDMFDDEPIQIFRTAIKILDVWAAVLYRQFSAQRNFILILSYDGEEIVLRFYSTREYESPWLDISSIESYLDGLMIIEI
ncbi:hypothetical protein [Paenibacillus sp. PAMC 26794]|uniref:hypothetical protein n=1 Tax=Paenibacillus sp. PAMC 26794 TaxID=1257080 RepID=UPI00037B792D|nr:hypothetical protein [Paenibacillus sp. PAMC 26794]